MNNDFLEKIQILIADQLPASTAGEMKKFIENSSSLEKELFLLKDKNAKLEASIKDVGLKNEDLNSRLNEFLRREAYIFEKESYIKAKLLELETRERNISLELINKELSQIKKSKEELLTLVDKVFSHPSVTISRQSGRDVLRPDDCNYGNTTYLTENITETTTLQKK